MLDFDCRSIPSSQPVLDDSSGKMPALTVFYHPHSWHCDQNCNTATVFPFDRTNPTLREKGGGGEGCLYVGNLTTGDKKQLQMVSIQNRFSD